MLRVCINTPAGPTDQRLHVSEKVLQYTLASISNSLHYRVMGILSLKYLNSSGTSLGTNATLLFKSSYGTCNLFPYSLEVCIKLFSVLKQTPVFYFSSLIFSNFHFGHLLIPSFKDWHCNKPQKSQSLVALFSVTSALIYICRFCLSETSCPQEDHFPPNLCVKVNSKPCNLPVSPDMLLLSSTFFFPACRTGRPESYLMCSWLYPQGYLPPTKNGVEPKRPSRPINITSLIRLSTTIPNTIVVSWTSEIGRVRKLPLFFCILMNGFIRSQLRRLLWWWYLLSVTG